MVGVRKEASKGETWRGYVKADALAPDEATLSFTENTASLRPGSLGKLKKLKADYPPNVRDKLHLRVSSRVLKGAPNLDADLNLAQHRTARIVQMLQSMGFTNADFGEPFSAEDATGTPDSVIQISNGGANDPLAK